MLMEELRHKPTHPFDYTDFEMSVRQNTCKELHKNFAHLPYSWVEYVYDFVKNTSEEELEDYKQMDMPSKRKLPNIIKNE